MDMAARPARAQILRSGLRFRRAGRDPEARARISGKYEFLEISEILQFGVDIAEPISRNFMIFIKQRGRYGYGGPPGPRTADGERRRRTVTESSIEIE